MQDDAFFPDDRGIDWIQSAFWDVNRKKYFAFLRDWDGEFLKGIRTIRYCTSEDFIHWTEPVRVQYDFPPTLDVQLYTNGIQAYPRAPHVFVGTPMRFMRARKKHVEHTYPGLSDGGLMTSRDGVNWNLWQEGFIRPGLDQQNWIQRNMMPSQGIVTTGHGELSLYWTEHYYQEGCHLRRGTLRTDGFVSLTADFTGGEMVTKPFVFEGHDLLMNYATSAAGSVLVEIQNEAGEPIRDFALDDCPEIYGDEIEHVVRWKRNPEVNRLEGQPIRLRFVLKDADLYSIKFRPCNPR